MMASSIHWEISCIETNSLAGYFAACLGPDIIGGYQLFKKTTIALVATSMLVACATPPKDIAPTYVSTGLYENLSCAQLREEAQVVSNRASLAYGQQDKNRSQDAAMTTVALVVFWPAAFFMKGDGASAAEVGRVKGEMQAIETVNRVKNCGIQFAPIA